LLESGAVAERLKEYFKARGYLQTEVVASAETEQLNLSWRNSPERVDVRLKRVYEVRLVDVTGATETRYVLAKSVGWGWLGYHAFVTGHRMQEFVPPILGLRDGILYTEWLPQKHDLAAADWDRDALIESLASYVAVRARGMCLKSDPAIDLAAEGRHKGLEMLASTLSRAYGSRIVAALKRPEIQRQLSVHGCPTPTLTDSKMEPQEWIAAGSTLLKVDFEHHGQGKNELGMTDPAYDLASAIFHFRLSEAESAELVRKYVEASGDSGAGQRLFLNKLLVGIWAQNLATLGLYNPRLLSRRDHFHRQFIAAWNFLVSETVRECGRLCVQPKQIEWRSPLVVADIDGVLDRMVFGFPSTTAAGIEAISLLHAHGFTVALNTARTLQEVKQYCRAYGFAGGIAEYGGVAWDAVTDRELVLVSAESLRELRTVRDALREIPGAFLNDDYQYSLRAFSYQNGRTTPLPPLLLQDLLAKLNVSRLRVHHTGLDSAIVAKETDKGVALQSFLPFVGLPSADVLAIGDSEPDLPMFRVAVRAFAPGNVTCRAEAGLIGCYVAGSAYQPGLLQIAQRIVHPEGGTCDRCRLALKVWNKHDDLFHSLLSAADQKPRSLLLRNCWNPSVLPIFKS
jgi:hydroxymethylpyrimidine pyrophosphatase-like HAD family hydrolase